ncbi:enoyl-CoA hydratase, partial [Rhodovulum sulfidophilum]|nr:enoyl-CoA hydratase [Rhodovulum sulfidophilum]
MKITENRTFDEISVGDTAQIVRICSEDDFYVFASASGNYNPMHLARLDGDGDGVDEALAPAIWEASLIS